MRHFVYKILAICILFGSILTGYYWWDYKTYLQSPLLTNGTSRTIYVEQGTNLTRLLHKLESKKIIEKPNYLLWHARIFANPNKLHIGEYQVTNDDTPVSLLDKLLSGKVKLNSITLIEGWSFSQFMSVINKATTIQHHLKELTDEQIMAKLGYDGVHPEGQFMPDTYRYPTGESDIVVLKQAYNAMQKYLLNKWPDRDVGLPFKSPYEALILASIVEKETGKASERKQIAGVFVKRLQVRMRLQTDPTIIYGMGDRFKGNIKRKDLKRDSPYNTYKYYGLPPTPIAMPSREAIDAVLQPTTGDALYFVSKGDGSHYFSSTLKEHNNAVIKYQLKGRKRPFSSYKKK